MTPPEAPNKPWWCSFFDDFYADFGLGSTSPEQNGEIAEFIIEHLELKPGDRLFDQCCGIGRLSIPLAEREIEIIGNDLSRTYINRAGQAAFQRNLMCEFHHADAFEFVAPAPCDGAINWFTSFGYSPDDEKNMQMLKRVHESLKPGGRFAMEIIHIPRVLSQFKQSFVERHEREDGELLLTVEHEPDFAAGMLNAKWTFFHPDGRRDERQIATRMLMPHELVAMHRTCGFEDIRLIGWPDGKPLTLESRRCVVLSRKPH